MSISDLTPHDLLAEAGIEDTPLRHQVVRLLSEADRPLAAPDILELVRREQSINKVSLYRILDLLVEHGLVRRLSSPAPPDRAFRYCLPGGGKPHHCHFYCTRCRKMECLDCTEAPAVLERLASGRGLVVMSSDIRLDGLCAECASKAGLEP
ncbi:Fur family transcriptional regulator [Oceanidesulfovibrio marinus]|uniref:Transcriptional repressor n=1 Tax=Oceanidesulfovibrio marinus TaxID=370038 RepID=A0A6P1ZGG3_9BACT|nr:transcriptional repressor [Oceanidesulfovibrio marinus]QJT11106.1 transcriptional repressor [Oceanidesulfovibrio marinus]TVM31725.1 transcriptional repressor [Oceanidesulfovibrio marinus]